MWELVAEKFGKALHLNFMNLVKIEPATAAWNHIGRLRIVLQLFALPDCIEDTVIQFFRLVHLFVVLRLLLALDTVLFAVNQLGNCRVVCELVPGCRCCLGAL